MQQCLYIFAMDPSPTLGSLLRNLIDHLDGAVEQAYRRSGLDYRPRFTPVVRTLLVSGPSSIRDLARHIHISHSAVSQTVAQMQKHGLVSLCPGRDGRERIVDLTPQARELLPTLHRHWTATSVAARDLEAELSVPLTRILREALAALDREPFSGRLDKAAGNTETRFPKGET